MAGIALEAYSKNPLSRLRENLPEIWSLCFVNYGAVFRGSNPLTSFSYRMNQSSVEIKRRVVFLMGLT